MKIKKIFLVIMSVVLVFSLSSCGMLKSLLNLGKDENTFDKIENNLKEIVTEDIEFDAEEGEDEGRSLLSECFDYEVEEAYKGTIKNSLYCENEGDGEWWCIVAFECGSEDEAKQLMDLISTLFYDSDWENIQLVVEGNVLLAATNEKIIDTALGK